jgi:VIT1/CCC1 family predicted Fe2+/Mn2+ transporter
LHVCKIAGHKPYAFQRQREFGVAGSLTNVMGSGSPRRFSYILSRISGGRSKRLRDIIVEESLGLTEVKGRRKGEEDTIRKYM